MQVCMVYRLGLIPYPEAWQLQKELAGAIARKEHPPALLICEHPHTYTIGRRGKAENLRWDEAELARRRISVYWVDRGGDITYHGPGQLVSYPVLPLASAGLFVATNGQAANGASTHPPQVDYIGYLRKLENMLILALRRLGIASEQISGLTGVWVRPGASSHRRDQSPRPMGTPAKIAAIGVKVTAGGISQHGFALNVHPDMSYWQGIIACGLKDFPAISMAELLASPPSMEQVMEAIITAFGEVFGYQMVNARGSELTANTNIRKTTL